MKAYHMAVSILMASLLFGPVASAQHNRGNQHGTKQSHSAPRERGVDRGHGRNEGRRVDAGFRHDHFGRDHHERLTFFGRPTFEFGGIWFGCGVWPSYWLATDYVYVDYGDGDYFLVNERYTNARVAIVIE